MKVIMVCSGGMSSAMVVDFENQIENYDLGLVAPQVKHRLDKFKKMGDEVGKPVDVVDPMGYTPIGAPKILKQIKGYDK